METIVAAIVTGIFALVVARQGKKTNEMHRMLTVNHHSSERPTILDELSDIKSLLLQHVTDRDLHHRDK